MIKLLARCCCFCHCYCRRYWEYADCASSVPWRPRRQVILCLYSWASKYPSETHIKVLRCVACTNNERNSEKSTKALPQQDDIRSFWIEQSLNKQEYKQTHTQSHEKRKTTPIKEIYKIWLASSLAVFQINSESFYSVRYRVI